MLVAVGVRVAVCVGVLVADTQLPAPVLPVHANPVLQPLVVCDPPMTASHIPLVSPVFAPAHDWQVALHPTSQQIPSTQLSEAQLLSLAHTWPEAFRQLPAPVLPLHAEGASQPLLVCSATLTGAQVPFGMPVLVTAHD